MLAIGVGAPKQEKWIAKYRNRLSEIEIFLAIGATIDFEAGYKLRAPRWMSECGLEWLYRLQSEPYRLWKRYSIDSLPFSGRSPNKNSLAISSPIASESIVYL